MSHLPILIPGRTEPVNVPCRLPESITFRAFLPSRGVREFTLWLTSTDPLKAEVSDVQPTNREGDPRGPDGWALDSDEQRHADDAAADVLDHVLRLLNLFGTARVPCESNRTSDCPPLHAIATAHVTECAAWDALFAAHKATTAPHTPFDEPNPATDETSGGLWASRAARMLDGYVERVTDAAVKVQDAKADKQAEEWQPTSHPEDANPPAWAERHEVTP